MPWKGIAACSGLSVCGDSQRITECSDALVRSAEPQRAGSAAVEPAHVAAPLVRSPGRVRLPRRHRGIRKHGCRFEPGMNGVKGSLSRVNFRDGRRGSGTTKR